MTDSAKSPRSSLPGSTSPVSSSAAEISLPVSSFELAGLIDAAFFFFPDNFFPEEEGSSGEAADSALATAVKVIQYYINDDITIDWSNRSNTEKTPH